MLGLELIVIQPRFKNRLLKYWPLMWATWKLLRARRPRLLFVQNPSIVLALWAGLVGRLQGSTVVVDRHSNFAQHPSKKYHPVYMLFRALSDISLRLAHITIVTNPQLADIVTKKGGTPAVMPDRLPDLGATRAHQIDSERPFTVVFICTFADDEPVEEVFDAARRLGDDFRIKVTGNAQRFLAARERSATIPDNIELLGFVDEADYPNLLIDADAIMPLTTLDYCLNCGAYEAISVGTPLIMSDTLAIRDYFSTGVEYTALNPIAIAEAVRRMAGNSDKRRAEIRSLRKQFEAQWQDIEQRLVDQIDAVAPKTPLP
ncbi:MAG: glycosyltransferase [Pseudomonadota bacterium]